MIKFIKEWVIPIALAVIAAILVKVFIVFNILVPSTSMYPTIKPGDSILVTKIYNFGKIKRGDILVFYSKERKERLTKRLIGLPGDKVEVTDDCTVYINGNKQKEPYVKSPGGKSGTYVVPNGKYFFLGDNRVDSLDSRYWQNPYIDKSDIMGKAVFIYFPFNRVGKLK